MDFIAQCNLLDAKAKRDWLLHQAALMVVKEPWSSFIKLDVVLRKDRFDRTDLLRLAAIWSDTPFPLRVSTSSGTGPITLGNTPYFGNESKGLKGLPTFPRSLGYDEEPARGCATLVFRFSSLEDPLLASTMSILNPYLPSLDEATLRTRVDYYSPSLVSHS